LFRIALYPSSLLLLIEKLRKARPLSLQQATDYNGTKILLNGIGLIVFGIDGKYAQFRLAAFRILPGTASLNRVPNLERHNA
jgi:hypothetical protein